MQILYYYLKKRKKELGVVSFNYFSIFLWFQSDGGGVFFFFFFFELLNSIFRLFLLSSPFTMVQSHLWMIRPMVKSFSVQNWI
jgi:hypothetical protein